MDTNTLDSKALSILSAHDASGESEPRLAADRIAAELAELPDSDIAQVNVDIDAAVTHVIGHWKGLEPYLAQLALLPQFDVTRVAKLRDYALALHYWHSLAQYASAPPAGLSAMVEKGIATRDRVLSMLSALAKFGLIEPSALASFGGSTAYRKVARDLTALSGFVHENWATLAGKSVLTLDEMHEAARLGHAIIEAVGDRDAAPAATAMAIRERDKTFTLFARAHDQARRALEFLRWDQGDADTIMPSIYGGRRSAKKRDGESEPAPRANVGSSANPIAPATAQPLALGAPQSSLLVADDEHDDA